LANLFWPVSDFAQHLHQEVWFTNCFWAREKNKNFGISLDSKPRSSDHEY